MKAEFEALPHGQTANLLDGFASDFGTDTGAHGIGVALFRLKRRLLVAEGFQAVFQEIDAGVPPLHPVMALLTVALKALQAERRLADPPAQPGDRLATGRARQGRARLAFHETRHHSPSVTFV